MRSESSNTHSILEFFLPSIRSVIGTYGQMTDFSPETVVEIAIAEFLEIDWLSHLAHRVDAPNRQAAYQILDLIPLNLRAAIDEYANETEMPSEFVVELAIAHFLNPDSMTYEDCQIGIGHAQVERLKQKREQTSYTQNERF
jgi:predicted transcriptional regulator